MVGIDLGVRLLHFPLWIGVAGIHNAAATRVVPPGAQRFDSSPFRQRPMTERLGAWLQPRFTPV